MKKLIISGALCAVVALGGAGVASAEETSTTTTTTTVKSKADMLAQIEQLMKLIASLQEQIKAAKGELHELAKDLSEGAEGDDVRKIQEVLATDPSLLAVKPTGFFGPMTREALEKFQERYGLEVTGKLDEATREAMKELREDGVKPGLLRSEEVKDRIRARLQEKWGDCDFTLPFRASLCEKAKDGHSDPEDTEGEDEDEEADSAEITREEARAAVLDAKEAIIDLEEDIEEMEDDDADEDDIEAAEDTLDEAEKELNKARHALANGDYNDAVEAAEEVIDIISGDDEDEEDEDDEDEDEDTDEDEEDEDDEEDEEEAS